MNQTRYEVSERIKLEVEIGEELRRIQEQVFGEIYADWRLRCQAEFPYQVEFPRKYTPIRIKLI